MCTPVDRSEAGGSSKWMSIICTSLPFFLPSCLPSFLRVDQNQHRHQLQYSTVQYTGRSVRNRNTDNTCRGDVTPTQTCTTISILKSKYRRLSYKTIHYTTQIYGNDEEATRSHVLTAPQPLLPSVSLWSEAVYQWKAMPSMYWDVSSSRIISFAHRTTVDRNAVTNDIDLQLKENQREPDQGRGRGCNEQGRVTALIVPTEKPSSNSHDG